MILAATIDIRQAAERTWDAVIIGAGPAGAIAARGLAQAGQAVLLVDRVRFPRNKVCGCCINQRAVATLDTLGLGHVVRAHRSVPLKRLQLAVGGQKATLPLPGGVALSRREFDAALVEEAVQAGATPLMETRAHLGPCDGESRKVRLLRDGQHMMATARMVIAANGLAGNLLASETPLHAPHRSRLGAGTVVEDPPSAYESGTVFMACGRGGYVGLVRLEDGTLDVAAAFDPRFVAETGHLGKAAETILHQARLCAVPGLSDRVWRGTPLLTRRLKRPCGERVLAIGDAAGYVEPFTGEGIAWALTSGAAAVQWLTETHGARIDDWIRVYRRTVVKRQWLCKLVAAALRRPRFLRLGITVLARAPRLAAPLTWYLNAVPAPQR
jgi:menaquinone-9 beta-reductase